MSKLEKWLLLVLSGASDTNLPFSDLRGLLIKLGFEERVKGSHHIYSRADVVEILNLQERNGKAKPYQVRQVRDVILKYQMARFNDE